MLAVLGSLSTLLGVLVVVLSVYVWLLHQAASAALGRSPRSYRPPADESEPDSGYCRCSVPDGTPGFGYAGCGKCI